MAREASETQYADPDQWSSEPSGDKGRPTPPPARSPNGNNTLPTASADEPNDSRFDYGDPSDGNQDRSSRQPSQKPTGQQPGQHAAEANGDAPPPAEGDAGDALAPVDDGLGRLLEMDEGLLQRAVAAGMTVREAVRLGDNLEFQVDVIERIAGNKPGQQPPPAEAVAEEFKLTLDPEAHDPEVVKAFGELQNHFNDQLKGLREQNSQLLQHYQNEEAKHQVEEIDRTFASLAEQFPSLGTKAGREMARNSPELSARQKVLRVADALASVPDFKNATREELFSTACQSVFGKTNSDQAALRERHKIGEQLRDGKGRFVQPPNSRSTKPTGSPLDVAAANADRFYRERGFSTGGDEEV